MKSLRIAILAPLKRVITPETTVSRNRVIVDLVSELIGRGHKVTIFGTGGSYLPGAEVIPIVPKALVDMPPAENEFYQHTSYLTKLLSQAVIRQGEFDLIHNHMYPEYLAFLCGFTTPMVTTLHSQMTALTASVLKEFPHQKLVAISHMAKRVADIDTIDVVHNSVDTEFFIPSEGPKEYLLAVGRMSKARDDKGNFLDPKGIGVSIQVAQKTGQKLKIVGNVEDPLFFETIVKPHLSDTIEFVGDVSSEQTLTREQMRDLFAGAKAFINPIGWEEPFGLVMAEALSVGTPVVAYNRGAVAEIVEEGKVGFVVDPSSGIDGFARALQNIGTIDRSRCRLHAVEHFSKARMADQYEAIYEKVLAKEST
jgi:glycosyltransferase involved in cell wall biosynthesis